MFVYQQDYHKILLVISLIRSMSSTAIQDFYIPAKTFPLDWSAMARENGVYQRYIWPAYSWRQGQVMTRENRKVLQFEKLFGKLNEQLCIFVSVPFKNWWHSRAIRLIKQDGQEKFRNIYKSFSLEKTWLHVLHNKIQVVK